MCIISPYYAKLTRMLSRAQGGFHELAYEPDGVKERFVDECTDWIAKRAGHLDRAEPSMPEDGVYLRTPRPEKTAT